MNSHIRVINPEAMLRMFKNIEAGNKELSYLNNADFEIQATSIHPPPDFKGKEEYPACCEYHRSIRDELEAYMDLFPFCCPTHTLLDSQEWFNKDDYRDTVPRTLIAIHYTEFHIKNAISKEDWFDDITEYFDYVVTSFGQLPDNYGGAICLGKFMGYMIHWISQHEVSNDYPVGRMKRLKGFLESYGSNREQVETPSVLNILIDNYGKWLKAFPFDISFLSHLKPRYQNRLVVLSGPPKINRYLKTAKSRIMTYGEQIEYLVNTTAGILGAINGLKLYESGHLTEPQILQLEIINAARKLELEELIADKAYGRQKYLKLIKKWMQGEKKYFKEITPILKQDLRNVIFG